MMSQHDQQERRDRVQRMFDQAEAAVVPPKPNRQQRRAKERADARARVAAKSRRQREAAARQARFVARARALARADRGGVNAPDHVQS